MPVNVSIVPCPDYSSENVRRALSAALEPLEGLDWVEPGMRVEHERFGAGEVVSVEGEGENAKAAIRFDTCGQKQLLLRFARIKRL